MADSGHQRTRPFDLLLFIHEFSDSDEVKGSELFYDTFEVLARRADGTRRADRLPPKPEK